MESKLPIVYPSVECFFLPITDTLLEEEKSCSVLYSISIFVYKNPMVIGIYQLEELCILDIAIWHIISEPDFENFF